MTERKPAASTDGRRRRGEDNRCRIVAALTELVREGEPVPTAEQVAARAAVGLRTVFRHFDDMESLYREIAAEIESRVRPIVEQPFASADWRGRLDEAMERRVRVFEAIMPHKLASSLHAVRSPFLTERHVWFAAVQRTTLAHILPPAIRNDRPLFDALDLALSFDSWAALRRDRKRSVARARAAIRAAVEALLKGKT